MHSFGAIFVEVRINHELCIPRLSRATGVYSAGRIVNPTTARSQMTGGIVWGLDKLARSVGVRSQSRTFRIEEPRRLPGARTAVGTGHALRLYVPD
ncbi:MAG: molybdopterin-dependent oxidoreductase [Chloroflexota bacterium]|nr:molybdopterin-dependent oxidoreductase [Chloroflexota bacterium]